MTQNNNSSRSNKHTDAMKIKFFRFFFCDRSACIQFNRDRNANALAHCAFLQVTPNLSITLANENREFHQKTLGKAQRGRQCRIARSVHATPTCPPPTQAV